MLAESDGDVLILPADHALRIAGRRHRDLHRAADHLLAGDSRTPHRLGASRSGRSFGEAMARALPGPRRPGPLRQRRRDPRRDRPRHPALRGHRAALAPRAIRCSGAARRSMRTASSRRPTARRISRRSTPRGPERPPSRERVLVSTRRGKQFNSMIQRDRSADRRRAGRHPDQRRGCWTGSAGGRAAVRLRRRTGRSMAA